MLPYTFGKYSLVSDLRGVTFIIMFSPASVFNVWAVCWLCVVGQHVVVHVNRGAVVDWVSETLSEDCLARVRRQAKQEEASLSGRKSVDWLSKEWRKKKSNCWAHFWILPFLHVGDLTLSTLMIWNFCDMSAGLEGSLDLPETKRRKRTRSSLVNSSKLSQNQPISWLLSVMSRYRTSLFSISTETSGRPQTSCSSCCAVSRERRGTGMMVDMPSLTAATWTQQNKLCFDGPDNNQAFERALMETGGQTGPVCVYSKEKVTTQHLSFPKIALLLRAMYHN